MIDKLIQEQEQAMVLHGQGLSQREIAKKMGISRDAVYRRLRSAKRRARLDPELADRLAKSGVADLAGLHSGWLIDKDKNGAGQSLYFYLGPDEEKLSFADAMTAALEDVKPMAKIPFQKMHKRRDGKDYANWVCLADLHVGGDYGDPQLEKDFYAAADDLVARLPPAEHAVLFELGDVLECNDHRGVTPASENPLDVKKGAELANSQTAVKLMMYLMIQLAKTHKTVDVELIKGNHDPTAYIAVMMTLEALTRDNPRINVRVTQEEYRVISWGKCAAFPHHGDTCKWPILKDVFADQFPDEWAAAKVHRHILTAHFHHDRRQDLLGCVAEHFRTLHGANAWAKARGLISRGSLTAITVHKEAGEQFRTVSNIIPA